MSNVFGRVMDFQPVDRLPRWEWAMWWDETIANWKQQGLPAELESVFDIAEYFGLDPYQQFWFSTTDDTIEAVQHHVEGIVSNMDDYLRLRPNFFPITAARSSRCGLGPNDRLAAKRSFGSRWKATSGFRAR